MQITDNDKDENFSSPQKLFTVKMLDQTVSINEDSLTQNIEHIDNILPVEKDDATEDRPDILILMQLTTQTMKRI